MHRFGVKNSLLKLSPIAALVLGTVAVASPAMAASPQASMPSTVAVNTPFKVTVSNIPTGTQRIDLVLVGMDNQPSGYFISSVQVSAGQTSVTLSGTIPSTMIFGSNSVTTLGGPREVDVDLIGGSNNATALSNTVNLTGITTDRSRDSGSPYTLSYDANTSQVTISGVPTNSYINVFFRPKGGSESQGSNNSLGSGYQSKSGPITIPVFGVPSQSGYLEAEILPPSGGTLDTNELPLSAGLPTGGLPEVPWAALIPAIGVGVGLAIIAKKRRNA